MDATGAFEIPDVPPGSLTLRAFAVAGGIDVSTTINVQTGKDLTGIDIPFPSQYAIDGKVVRDPDNGTAFRPRFWLTLTGSRAIMVYSTVQADGSFTVRFPVGEWNVSVGGLPINVTLKSFTYGEKNLLAEKINVAATDMQRLRMADYIPNRDFTDLTLRGISGRVVMETGTLDRGLYFQANDGRGTSGAGVGSDGSFTLILAEGSYRLQMSALPAGTYIKSISYGTKAKR